MQNVSARGASRRADAASGYMNSTVHRNAYAICANAGALFPDALEPLLPSRTLEFPRCWVPRISWQWRLPLLEDINPRLFGGSRRGGARQKGTNQRGAGKR